MENNNGSNKHEFHQHIIVLRHGDRIDQIDPSWLLTASRPWDPHLVDAGLVRAFSTGKILKSRLTFPIHRVFVSPFLRCVQTAAEAIYGVCSASDTDRDVLDPSKIKVTIEHGLCEALFAFPHEMAMEFNFNVPGLETLLPDGTVDHTVKPVYEEVPPWEETVENTRTRYVKVFKALADKFPSENLLLITHLEGVATSISEFMKGDVTVSEIEYCAYSELRRTIRQEGQTFTADEFEVITESGQNGIVFNSA